MEVAPAGQFENDLHLTADRLPYQHFITQFLWVGCSSCRPTNSVKALKALELKACLNQLKIEMTRRAISISVGFPSLYRSRYSRIFVSSFGTSVNHFVAVPSAGHGISLSSIRYMSAYRRHCSLISRRHYQLLLDHS